MKVTIVFEQQEEQDGVDTTVIFSQDKVETIYDLMSLYSDASRGVGFSYVDRMGYSTEKGAEHWSKF